LQKLLRGGSDCRDGADNGNDDDATTTDFSHVPQIKSRTTEFATNIEDTITAKAAVNDTKFQSSPSMKPQFDPFIMIDGNKKYKGCLLNAYMTTKSGSADCKK
jgi:hypothetical protein